MIFQPYLFLNAKLTDINIINFIKCVVALFNLNKVAGMENFENHGLYVKADFIIMCLLFCYANSVRIAVTAHMTLCVVPRSIECFIT